MYLHLFFPFSALRFWYWAWKFDIYTYTNHTYYNAFHGRSSFIYPLLSSLGEWVDEHIYRICLCYVTHFHFIFTKTLSNFKKLNVKWVCAYTFLFVKWLLIKMLCPSRNEHDTWKTKTMVFMRKEHRGKILTKNMKWRSNPHKKSHYRL